MQEIRSSNPAVATGICDTNKSRARHHLILTSILIFHYHHLVTWWKLQSHAVGGPSDFVWVYLGYQARKGLHTGTVKIDPHKFCHLK